MLLQINYNDVFKPADPSSKSTPTALPTVHPFYLDDITIKQI